ncbi:MAG: FG-GAP repeat domain-containing protein, partial [Planctomycetota bacterium]
MRRTDRNLPGSSLAAIAAVILVASAACGQGIPDFETSGTIPILTPRSLVFEDLNQDGHVDLAAASFAANEVAVLFGDGSGGFSAPEAFL